MNRRVVRDLWYHVARLREAKGDNEGAARARLNAYITGEPRPRGTIR